MRKNIWIPVVVIIIILLGVAYFTWIMPQYNGSQSGQSSQYGNVSTGASGTNASSTSSASSTSTNAQSNLTFVTTTDPGSHVTFEYPETLGTKYIFTPDWPPKVAVMNEPFTCTQAGSETAPGGKTVERTINGREYCVTSEVGGAAGSVYTNYAFATEKNGKELIFTFSTRAVQCGNYGEPQMTECNNERQSFNLDSIVDRIAQSAVL